MSRSRSARRCLAVLACAAAFLPSCGTETPTRVGSDLRTHPDSMRVVLVDSVRLDSVFYLPVSLGRSPTAQVGQHGPYKTHVLYDFKVPTRVLKNGDSLRLDTATFLVATDSVTLAPYTGSMRLGLREVAPSGRYWATISLDSAIATPEFGSVDLARDTLLAGARLVDRLPKLSFAVDLRRVAGYDTVVARGDTLDFNVALVFKQFDVPGRGFFEYAYKTGTAQTAQFIGFSNADPSGSIETLVPTNHRVVVEYDSTYPIGTKLAVSDGYRLHSHLRFKPLARVLPELAAVSLAELVLTQVDSVDGTSFGTGPELGMMAPTDSTLIYDKKTNEQGLNSRTSLVAVPGAQVTLSVTGDLFSIQEKLRQDNGFLLRLSNEGTKVRHFEFYGGAAPASVRPFLRILYTLPARFEGGGR